MLFNNRTTCVFNLEGKLLSLGMNEASARFGILDRRPRILKIIDPQVTVVQTSTVERRGGAPGPKTPSVYTPAVPELGVSPYGA
ncbi:hypothetical protein N7466_002375 [Penicillium verhagenii]|uniref:uncharacterized protein n=1 Tax=Penicillium verhagenii TaxID=1562060 RepID=UPI0025452E81|nr:uncharacterized protein N7466_002375 [Penicillium verhagenii]KAJ5939241.1 hypothetical protein N7466_002375 [Penicillium verhagenii]